VFVGTLNLALSIYPLGHGRLERSTVEPATSPSEVGRPDHCITLRR